MTVDRECDSPNGGVKAIRKICQLVEGVIVKGGWKEAWRCVTVVRKSASPQ